MYVGTRHRIAGRRTSTGTRNGTSRRAGQHRLDRALDQQFLLADDDRNRRLLARLRTRVRALRSHCHDRSMPHKEIASAEASKTKRRARQRGERDNTVSSRDADPLLTDVMLSDSSHMTDGPADPLVRRLIANPMSLLSGWTAIWFAILARHGGIAWIFFVKGSSLLFTGNYNGHNRPGF